MELLILGHMVTLESSLSATTTSRPVVSKPNPTHSWQACATAWATSSSAVQSSRLYVMSLAFIDGSLVCCHSSRHTMDCRPVDSAADHLNPNQPAISFNPFEYVGK